MFILDTPPELILPERPAIILPGRLEVPSVAEIIESRGKLKKAAIPFGMFSANAQELPEAVLIASVGVSSGATITVPTSGAGGTVLEGDIAILIDWSWTGTSTVDVFPTGWGTFLNAATPNTERMHVSWKNLEAGDIGAAVTGINGTTNSSKLLLIYRRKDGANCARFGDVTFNTPTGSDPAASTVTLTGRQLPAIVLGVAASTNTNVNLTEAPTSPVTIQEGGGNRIKVFQTIYDRGDTIAGHNFNQGDNGGNAPWSALLQIMTQDEAVELLLRGDAHGTTTFTDSSLYGRTVTRVGNVTNSSVQSKYGGTSMFFDGTGDYLTMDNVRDEFQRHDFTVEGWFYQTVVGTNGPCLFDMRSSGHANDPFVRITTGNVLQFQYENAVRASIATFSLNAWHHVAITRKRNTVKCWLDGVQVGSDFITNNTRLGSKFISIGTFFDQRTTVADYKWPGFIDNFRIINGYSAYNADFTPADFADPVGSLV